MDTKRSYNQYKYRCKIKKLAFCLSLIQFKMLINRKCYICNKASAAGLDRVDNTKGYYWNNVEACCFDCNRMKSNKTRIEFIEYLTRLNPKHSLITTFNRLMNYEGYNKKVNSSHVFMKKLANGLVI